MTAYYKITDDGWPVSENRHLVMVVSDAGDIYFDTTLIINEVRLSANETCE